MDPIGNICRVIDSFHELEPVPQLDLDLYLSLPNGTDQLTLIDDIDWNEYYDLTLWEDNNQEEDRQKQDPNFARASESLRPINVDILSIFTHIEGVPLANIDAIYHFTGDMFKSDNLDRRIASGFGYIILGRNDGWVEYLQYRCPNGNGYGLNPRSNPWDINALNLSRFRILYGDDGSGEVDSNINWLINFLTENRTLKMDLILCAEPKYFTSSVLLALNSCIVGGNAIFALGTEIDPSILYCLCQSFEHSSFFYPFTNDPNNGIRYLICWNRRSDQILAANRDLLASILSSGKQISFSRSSNLVGRESLMALPPSTGSIFTSWLKNQNDYHLLRQQSFLIERQEAIMDSSYSYYPLIDLYKLKLVLSLPLNDYAMPDIRDSPNEDNDDQELLE